MATLNNRVNTSLNQATRTWADNNDNFIPDCDLTNPERPDRRAGGDKCGQLNAPLGIAQRRRGLRPVDHAGLRRPAERSGGGRSASSTPSRTAWRWTSSSRVTAFGNFIASQNTTRPPSAYNSFCVTAPTDAVNGRTLPAAIRFAASMDLQPAFFTTVPFYQVQKASNFGDVSDVYTGYDVNLTARLPRGGMCVGRREHRARGHGRLRSSVRHRRRTPAVTGVLASSPARSACEPVGYAEHALLPRAAAVPGGRQGVRQLSAAVVRPERQRHAAEPGRPADLGELHRHCSARCRSSGRPLGRGATTASTSLIAPGTLYGKRVTQVDGRLGKTFKLQRCGSKFRPTSSTC